MTASGQSHQLGSQNVNDFLTGPFLLFLLKPSINFRLHHVHGLFKWTRSFSQRSRLTHPLFLKIVFKLLEWLNSLSFIRLLRLHRRSDLKVEWLKSIAAMAHRTRRSGVIVSMNTSGYGCKNYSQKYFRCILWKYPSWWFQTFFIFTPIWGSDPIWRAYFSNGLKPPTSITLSWILSSIFPRRCSFYLENQSTSQIHDVPVWFKTIQLDVVSTVSSILLFHSQFTTISSLMKNNQKFDIAFWRMTFWKTISSNFGWFATF